MVKVDWEKDMLGEQGAQDLITYAQAVGYIRHNSTTL